MRAFLAITMETFTCLRRDKVFRPVLIFGAIFMLFCWVVSEWSLEEFKKIIFDLGSFGYEMIGIAVALLWGAKIISDARSEGSIEFQLASSISRATWLLGKVCGLFISLILIGITLTLFWQVTFWAYGFPLFAPGDLSVFLLITLEWLIVAAMAMFFSTLASLPIALFSSLGLWICGIAIAPVTRTLPETVSPVTRFFLHKFTTFWDLTRLHIVDQVLENGALASRDLNLRIIYAVCLIVFFLTAATLVFRNRDMV